MRINVQGEIITQVEQFVYLEGLIGADGSHYEEAQKRIGRTLQAVGRVNRIMEKQIKPGQIMQAMTPPIFLFGTECWTMRKQDEKRIFTAGRRRLWKVAGVSIGCRKYETLTRNHIETTLIDNVIQWRF